MSQDVINENTDENIKNYLAEDEEKNKTENDKWSDVSGGNENKNNAKKNKKLIFAVLFLVVAVVIAAAYFMYLKGQQSFDKEKVKIEINAPGEVASGDEITFTIEYRNETGVKLRNPRIIFFTPEKFVFTSSDKKPNEGAVLSWNVDDLAAGEAGKIKLFGRITGNKNSEHEFNSKISYVPNNFNYEFQSADNLSKIKIEIIAVSFELSLKCPEEIITGNEIDCLIAFENISDNDFRKINLKVDFPKGFTFISAEPEVSGEIENSLSWQIREIKAKEKGKLVVKGNLTGEKNGEKEVKVVMNIFGDEEDLLEYISKEAIIKVREVPIVLEQTVNGLKSISVNKGEEIEYKIKFKNISKQELKGLVINSELAGSVDFDSTEVVNGSYDKKLNKIIWSAFNVPKLAVFKPGDEDEVSFKIRAIDYFEVKSPEDKNFVVKNKVTINSFNFDNDEAKIEKEIASDEITVKINAFLFVRTKGYFNDDGRIENSGAIPPEVEKETTYTIHWTLNNLLGDLKNVKIASVLPDNVKWTGNYIKSNGEISLGDENNGTFIPEDEEENILRQAQDDTQQAQDDTQQAQDDINESRDEIEEGQIIEEKFYYNTATREIIWEMPELSANTGLISPSKEIVYQISIIPEESDVGKTIKIMNEVGAVGFDEFTNEEVTTLESELTTELPDDYSIGVEEGIVIKLKEE